MGIKRPYLVGKGNHNWKGGVSSKNEKDRIEFKRYIQKEVLKRDGYTCQLCRKGGSLQVDHIQSFADYVDLRFSMDNCRTLCQKCHYELTYDKPMNKSSKLWGNNLIKKEGRGWVL